MTEKKKRVKGLGLRVEGTGAGCLGDVVLERAELCHLIEVVARRHELLLSSCD